MIFNEAKVTDEERSGSMFAALGIAAACYSQE
jgi:hypothetical protein